jgi:hypothetical protein
MTFNPTVKKIITLPILKLENGKTIYVRFLVPIIVGMTPQKRAGAIKEPAAPLFGDVVVLDSGITARLPIHPKLNAILKTTYPNDAYVDKCFAITKQIREAGRQFTPFHVAEIDDPNAPTATVAAGEVAQPVATATKHASGRR